VPPLPLANLGGSRLKLGHFGVETFRLLGVARQFCAVRAEEAHEGPSGSRLPRAVPRSRSRGVPAPQGNAHRRALEDGAQHHRPAGALSLPEHRFPPPFQRKYPGATLRIFARRSSVASVGLRRPLSKWLRWERFMPHRFATAVWVSPAAMRQCRTFFANCDTPLLLLVLEVWRSFSAISHSAYPTSLDCRDDDRRFICKQQFPEHRHELAQ
jgi:hypothetical protein